MGILNKTTSYFWVMLKAKETKLLLALLVACLFIPGLASLLDHKLHEKESAAGGPALLTFHCSVLGLWEASKLQMQKDYI